MLNWVWAVLKCRIMLKSILRWNRLYKRGKSELLVYHNWYIEELVTVQPSAEPTRYAPAKK